MSQGSRPDRVGDQLRAELSELLMREVQDPGIGFLTITRVEVSPDLQQARVFYTVLGDQNARRDTVRALRRVNPFLRRRIGARLRLRRTPELHFIFDESIGHQARIEQIIHELHEHEPEAMDPAANDVAADGDDPSDHDD